MKTYLKQHWAKSMVFGIILTILGYFSGVVQHPSESGAAFPPIWLQLLGIFLLSAVIFFLLNSLWDYIAHKIKGR